MTVVRTWVFPVLRIVIFLAIAAALVKLAFFAEPASTSESSLSPTGEVTEPVVPVTVGTITNDVVVDGTVAADAAVPVKATLAGAVVKLLIAPGQATAADTPVMTLRSETPGAFNSDGTQAKAVVKTVTVLAGSAGIVSALPVIVGQTVAIGDAVAQVAPTTFNVSGTIAPAQQYRLLAKPADASVTITGGPAPFTCTGLTITTALAGAGAGTDAGSTGSDTGSGTGATVRCAVPAEVTVFAGLAAKMTLAGGVAENVLTVPVTAVEGSAGTGNVYLLGDDGTPTAQPVTLGLNDGTNVQITGGVEEGTEVMQFVPGAEQPGTDIGGGCTQYPDGSTVCGG